MSAQPPEFFFTQLKAEKPSFESEDWTESDTRSKYIDRLLIDCLRWREVDIRRELHTAAGRLDYILTISRPAVVVEAKRSTAKLYTRRAVDAYRVKLDTLFKSDPGCREVIEQAQGYCAAKSVPLAVVTNGRTIAAFIAVRTDGTPWEQGDVMIFPDVFAEDFNFSELYNHLSRDAVIAGTLHKRLRSDGAPTPPRDVVSSYPDPKILLAQNPLGRALEPVLKPLFAQLANAESIEVIRNCYVLPPTSRSKDPEVEALIRNRVPHFAEDAVTVDSLAAFRQFEETLHLFSGSSAPGTTLLVIGGIGAGKTTFLRRFFELELPAKEAKSGTPTAVPLYVNFQTPPSDPADIARFIYESLRQQIEALDEEPVPGEKDKSYDLLSTEGLEHIFLRDYQKFLKNEGRIKATDPVQYESLRTKFLGGLRDDDRRYVIAAVQALQSRYHRNVFVIVDNVDQCEADFQRQAYIFCKTLEQELQTVIIVALREEWYWYHGVGREGPLSAYHNVTFHIPAPRVRDILEKRLAYAIELLETKRIQSQPITTPAGVRVEPKHLEMYVKSCKSAFFKSDEIALFLESLSNGSLRSGLERFLDFVRSGHTHEHEYLEAFVEGKEYVIRFHQMFKSIAYGIYRHYSSDRSRVANVYRPVFFGSGHLAYFLNIYLLRWMQSRVGVSSSAGRGYVPHQEIAAEIRSFGIPDELVDNVIENLVRVGWVVPDVPLPINDVVDGSLFRRQQDIWRFIRLTPWGHYTIEHLAHRFAYLEAAMLDTPLLDGSFVDRLTKTYGEGSKVALDFRRPMVLEFVEVLEKIEEIEREGFAGWAWAKDFPPFMAQVRERLEIDLRKIDHATELMRAN